jgi:hypothetical protein
MGSLMVGGKVAWLFVVCLFARGLRESCDLAYLLHDYLRESHGGMDTITQDST